MAKLPAKCNISSFEAGNEFCRFPSRSVKANNRLYTICAVANNLERLLF